MVLRSLVGASVKRKEDPGLITGSGKYVDDIKLPGMCHVAFLRSPYAHAKILSIDITAAEAREGVLAVVTGDDLRDQYEPVPVAGGDHALEHYSHLALSVDRVRHVGEVIAAVIASSAEAAADALEDVEVDWEELPAAADLLSAYSGNAPPVFDGLDSNIIDEGEKKTDDIDEVFASAPRTISQRMLSQRVAGVPMEVRAVAAAPDAVTGGLTLWSSTQIPHGVRTALAGVLRLPESTLRVIAPNVGGGFGVKNQLYPEEIVVAKLAQMYNMPLKWGRHARRALHLHYTWPLADRRCRGRLQWRGPNPRFAARCNRRARRLPAFLRHRPLDRLDGDGQLRYPVSAFQSEQCLHQHGISSGLSRGRTPGRRSIISSAPSR